MRAAPTSCEKERRYLELRALRSPGKSQKQELQQLEKELDPYWTSGPANAGLKSPDEILKRKA